MKYFKYYLLVNIVGIVLNMFAISIILERLKFDYKSSICVFVWSVIGYFIKTWIFTIPLLGINKYNEQSGVKILYLLLPFLFMLIWYSFIIVFEIESVSFDYSFGYFQRFPHGLVQIATMFLVCLMSIVLFGLKVKDKKAKIL